MQPFWPMVRLAQVKLTLWKDSSIMQVIHKEVLFPEVWKKSSGLSRCSLVRTPLSW